ncbi:MAG: hypothetical protein ACXAEU_15430 [Candidatus Hodarchaeales archaeon]|jgi:hypothetical protein
MAAVSALLEKISHGSHEAFTEEIKDRKGIKKILKQGSIRIGTYDYYFIWGVTPSIDDIKDLTRRIDETLAATVPTRYTITTTELPGELTDFDLREDSALSLLKFFGPSIIKAIEKMEESTDEIPEIFPVGSLGEGITMIGEFDFSFTWGRYPNVEMIKQVIDKVDDLLTDTGASYTITTFGKMKKADKQSEDAYQQAIRKTQQEKVLYGHRK